MYRLISVAFVAIAISCGVESTEIGSDLFTGGAIDISYVDSATVSLSTIKFDSLVTSAANRVMIGSYEDERLGRTTAASFMAFTIPSNIGFEEDDESHLDFDYLALVLKYDDYYYADTTSALTLNVHRLTQEISGDDYGYLYNTSTFEHEENSLGSLTFLPRPTKEDSIEIELSDALGEELLAKMFDNDEVITSQTEFLKYFHGLYVVPDTSSSASVVGFSNAPELRLYYRDKSLVPSTQKYIAFNASTENVCTWIHGNRTTTPLAALRTSRDKMSAVETNNESYMQAGAGMALRVDMPYLRSLTQAENFYVSKAILDLYPISKSHTSSSPLPASLVVHSYDKRNTLYGSFEATATLYEDTDLQRDTYYQFDVTSFVRDQMALEEFNENGLVLTLADPDYRNTINRLYMANAGNGYKTKLRIYFATLNY
ncbi:MAG TPA: DUF4270 family protein [Cyclobacteriaceae bacterium]|nr:DUF4270 family protein [Cyclobacteriaceae bacterium]